MGTFVEEAFVAGFFFKAPQGANLLLFQGSSMVGDMVSPQVPLVLHLLLADLAGELPADGVHVENVLLQIELVAEHPLAVLTHPRLPALPGGTQEGGHLGKDQLSALAMWNLSCDG